MHITAVSVRCRQNVQDSCWVNNTTRMRRKAKVTVATGVSATVPIGLAVVE